VVRQVLRNPFHPSKNYACDVHPKKKFYFLILERGRHFDTIQGDTINTNILTRVESVYKVANSNVLVSLFDGNHLIDRLRYYIAIYLVFYYVGR